MSRNYSIFLINSLLIKYMLKNTSQKMKLLLLGANSIIHFSVFNLQFIKKKKCSIYYLSNIGDNLATTEE